MREEISNVCNKVSVDTVHVTWRGYNRVHIFVAIMNTFLYLGKNRHIKNNGKEFWTQNSVSKGVLIASRFLFFKVR